MLENWRGDHLKIFSINQRDKSEYKNSFILFIFILFKYKLDKEVWWVKYLYERIIINRGRIITDQLAVDEQTHLLCGRGCVDLIFLLRKLVGKD